MSSEPAEGQVFPDTSYVELATAADAAPVRTIIDDPSSPSAAPVDPASHQSSSNLVQKNKRKLREQRENEENAFKCHVMYAMADNNLDGAISQDVQELISNTNAVHNPKFYPLIFIDRHQVAAAPIKGLKAKNGIDDSDYHSGVRYIEKNFETNQMQVVEEFGELDFMTMTDFLTWAFKRCKSKDADARVLFTLGSHGYGWKGFGGDENDEVLLQESAIVNNGVKTAILDAITAVGMPTFTQLDLLGFDACSMMSVCADCGV